MTKTLASLKSGNCIKCVKTGFYSTRNDVVKSGQEARQDHISLVFDHGLRFFKDSCGA